MLNEVESLLAHADSAASFLSRPAVEIGPVAGTSEEDLTGGFAGPYQLTKLLGRGGMGAVYEAVRADGQFQQTVAVKLIRSEFAGREALSRFRHERQMLASLEHANIARLFDGGVTSNGQPYFVMELVRGIPITEYARQAGLEVTARLLLFLDVCSAVQHAHDRLIVHRDIKPGNILVDNEGNVKLLDFGIAKALDAEALGQTTGLTRHTGRLMTPEYASPEQVRGEPVTTATDVYALGVLLYELLVEARPYPLSSYSAIEMERVICQTEPPRPSAAAAPPLRKRLRGDLDNILLKALQKSPSERYRSAEQFAADIRAHLDGRPVLARPATLAYRAGKFVRRHKTGVAVAALVTVSVAGGIASTLWQGRIAERRFQDVRKLARSYIFEVYAGVENLPGATPLRKLLATRATEYLDRLALDSGRDRGLLEELAQAYAKLAQVEGSAYRAHTGESGSALSNFRKAIAINERLIAMAPGDRVYQAELARMYVGQADVLFLTGQMSSALDSYRKAAGIQSVLLQATPRDESLLRDLATSYTRAGTILLSLGQTAASVENHRKALEIDGALLDAKPDDPVRMRDLQVCHLSLGDALLRTGDRKSAASEYDRGLALAETILDRDPRSGLARQDVAYAARKVGNLREQSGDVAAALRLYRRALALGQELYELDPKNVIAQRELSITHINLGDVLMDRGELVEAASHYTAAAGIRRALDDADPSNWVAKRDLTVALDRTGELEMKRGRPNAALAPYEQSLRIREALARGGSAPALAIRDLAASYENVSEVLVRLEKKAQAVSMLEQSVALLRELSAKDPADAAVKSDLDRVERRLRGLAPPPTAGSGGK
jgi:non-specific serine/threonine protein kinase/serine/threonine-protein kinase